MIENKDVGVILDDYTNILFTKFQSDLLSIEVIVLFIVELEEGVYAVCFYNLSCRFAELPWQCPARCMSSSAGKRSRVMQSSFPVLDLPLHPIQHHIYEANLRNSTACHKKCVVFTSAQMLFRFHRLIIFAILHMLLCRLYKVYWFIIHG